MSKSVFNDKTFSCFPVLELKAIKVWRLNPPDARNDLIYSRQ